RLLWLSTPLLLLSTIPPSSSTFTLPLHDALPILFDRAYSSDLARAVSTAQMVLEQNNHTDVSLLQTLPELREQFFGYFDGISNTIAAQAIAQKRGLPTTTTFAQLTRQLGPFEIINAIHEADPTGDAETAAIFWQRLMSGFKQIATESS